MIIAFRLCIRNRNHWMNFWPDSILKSQAADACISLCERLVGAGTAMHQTFSSSGPFS
jgi:hypothetical protein